MPTLAVDGNAKPISALRPTAAADVNGASVGAVSSVLRLSTKRAAYYGLDGVADVYLPAGVVEYIKVNEGDIVTTSREINIVQML